MFPVTCDVCGTGVGSPCETCEQAVLAPHTRPLLDVGAVVHAVVRYEAGGRELVRSAKFRGRPSALNWLARHMASAVDRKTIDAVTWIPSSRPGWRRRGVDPGGQLARRVADCLDVPVVRTMRRHGSSHQVGKGRAERSLGPRLELRPGLSSPRRYLLVDDICTTGASIRRAVELLGTSVAAIAVAASTPAP